VIDAYARRIVDWRASVVDFLTGREPFGFGNWQASIFGRVRLGRIGR
jgi:hypothetical protein